MVHNLKETSEYTVKIKSPFYPDIQFPSSEVTVISNFLNIFLDMFFTY